MRQTGECHEVDWLIETPSLLCCSSGNLCCRRGGYHLWDRQVSGMWWIDWLRPHLSSAAPQVTSAVDEEDIIYETDRWLTWGGLIDGEPSLPCCSSGHLCCRRGGYYLWDRQVSVMRWFDWLRTISPLVTSAVDEKDIIYETDRWMSWGLLINW